ncbi:MAG: ABC transporter permease [Ruminococcus sp.]|nr:ABC transporter permease [Ruminococcus sp.]
MGILTLLKANIRRKKGSFVSVIILMIIISLALTAVLSISESSKTSIANALEYADAPNITTYFSAENMSDELMTSLKSHKLVDRVESLTVANCFLEFNGKKDGNNCYVQKYDSSKFRRLKDDCSDYSNITDKPKKGEIFVTQGYLTRDDVKIGDTLKVYNDYSDKPVMELTIGGIVVEPTNGASTIGWKQAFVSDEDYKTLIDNSEKDYYLLKIYKTENCELNDRQFRRQLNVDTSVIDKAFGSMAREESLYYTGLFSETIISILLVFLVFLMIIVLIMIKHSISTSVEIDYVNLGVLKAMGFSKGKIRIVFVLQYLIAQVIGAVIGFALAVPVAQLFGNIFQPIIAIPNDNTIAVVPSVLILISVLIISGFFILLSTRKISRISPIRAISGFKKEIYFDSRIKVPISKKLISSSLALRQFISNKKRYISTIIIASLLVFFMLTITSLGDTINSKSANEAMGIIYTEISISLKDTDQYDKKEKEIDEVIEKSTNIEKKYMMRSEYMSLNGENIFCFIYKNPQVMNTVTGRAPLYDNEIAITDFISDELGINIGDTVTVSKRGYKADFLITGFIQTTNDVGRAFAMNADGIERMGIDDYDISWVGYSVSDSEHNKEIAKELNNKYRDILECTIENDDSMDGTIEMAILAMKAVIYSLSIIFALVVVIMVCKKSFLQEKTDIGIYKAVGFKIRKLRLQFAVRFLIVALISSTIGSVLSLAFSAKVMSLLLRSIGISSLKIAFTANTFVVPISLICVCFFLFAYIVSRRIKKVDIKELITE